MPPAFPALLLGALALSGAAPREPALERAVLAEINFARAHPREYADQLRTYRRYFRGKIVYYPGRPTGLITAEGVKAVNEAIAFLERQAPLPRLAQSRLLARAAGDHVAEQGPRGRTGHVSTDGTYADTRVRRRGGGGNVGEVITYGPPTAVEVVRQLIVDDAVKDRGHRHAVFSTRFTFAGAGCGPHRGYRKMCVVVMSRSVDGR